MSSIVESLYNKYLVEDFNDNDYFYLSVSAKLRTSDRESNKVDNQLENILEDLSAFMEDSGIADNPSISTHPDRDSDICVSQQGINNYEFILRIPMSYILRSFRPRISSSNERLYVFKPGVISKEI